MLNAAEIVILLVVIAVVFGLHKLPWISRGIARLRLRFDKAVADDYIEVAANNGDDESKS